MAEKKPQTSGKGRTVRGWPWNFKRNHNWGGGRLQRQSLYICGEGATMAPAEDMEGNGQPLPRDSDSIQRVPAAEKYVEITCCKVS